MSGKDVPVPVEVVSRVDNYVAAALVNAAKYENSEPLDESGVWSLHRLAADIYAMGWTDGAHVEAERRRGEREHDRLRVEAVSDDHS